MGVTNKIKDLMRNGWQRLVGSIRDTLPLCSFVIQDGRCFGIFFYQWENLTFCLSRLSTDFPSTALCLIEWNKVWCFNLKMCAKWY